ncbi:SDR family oxidoreductase [Rhodococcus sp. 06-1460-1B]|uniref:SDR family oxidoreductase n=1 Tax=Rhodococcus sp. 06-1460-1B TaxID=2022501 RepID=UPI000B9C17F9|nr:SDR family oxidoreductase [Rhodococcus sp. 06-1460-1B]OZD63134.1 hypothetical protein CH268_09325 [Rhodococcus sp. 06-1460-1B]
MKTRAVLLTGAAGGIGGSIREQLEKNVKHCVVGLDSAYSSDTDREFRVDLADRLRLVDVVDTIQRSYTIVGIVHCAAVQFAKPAGSASYDDWLTSFAVNIVSLDYLVGRFSADLRSSSGAVVAVSSVHATVTSRSMAPYAATKGALEAWTRAAALDLAPDVTVNSIAPGAISTAKLEEGFSRWENGELRRSLLNERTPAGRIGSAEEVAALTEFLLSDSAKFITGTTVKLDGGASVLLGTEV